MIYELRSRKYLENIINNRDLKENLSYIEVLGMSYTLKIILEEAIDYNQKIIIDDKIVVSNDYKHYYGQFGEPIVINLDSNNNLIATGYYITKTGKVILNITNYNLVLVLDITLPYYSESSIHIYDSIINLRKLKLSYIEEVVYK